MLVLGVMSLIGVPVILIEMFETQRRRMRMKQRHEDRLQERASMLLDMWRDESNRRQELEQIVAAQAADHSPLAVPVTHCERRERRRRFLPLEVKDNESR